MEALVDWSHTNVGSHILGSVPKHVLGPIYLQYIWIYNYALFKPCTDINLIPGYAKVYEPPWSPLYVGFIEAFQYAMLKHNAGSPSTKLLAMAGLPLGQLTVSLQTEYV